MSNSSIFDYEQLEVLFEVSMLHRTEIKMILNAFSEVEKLKMNDLKIRFRGEVMSLSRNISGLVKQDVLIKEQAGLYVYYRVNQVRVNKINEALQAFKNVLMPET